MATKAQTTMLRELSAAGDRERTGALDVEWDGTRASLFFVFGHANHVELERADGGKLVGSDALSALVDELPDDFRVAPWRRTMVTDDTLRCSAEELMSLFRRHPSKTTARGAAKSKAAAKRKSNGSPRAAEAASPAPPTDAAPVEAPPTPAAPSRAVPFDLEGFPLLPLGTALFADDAGHIEGLDGAVPHLPDCLILLTGRHARGVVLVAGGAVADAAWVDQTDGLVGADAARAVFSAAGGTVTAHRIDDPRLVVALPVLWRAPRVFAPLPGRSLNVDNFVAAVREAGHSCALLVAGSDDPGVALFNGGELVAVYTSARPAPVTTKAALSRLLRASGAQATLLRAGGGEGDAEIGGTTFAPAAHAGDAATAEFPEFVPTRVDVEIDALRAELIAIADRWLGADDAAPVAAAILAARPGVDDFVTAIRTIAALDISGHESAVVRAMAREMHYRAAEALTGV